MYERLTDFLKARGITREQLAAQTELSISTLNRLCTGKHRAQSGTIQKLAKALRVSEEKVTGMLKKQRIAMSQPEQLQTLGEAMAVCRAIARGKARVDVHQAKPVMTSLVIAANNALKACEGNVARLQLPRQVIVAKESSEAK